MTVIINPDKTISINGVKTFVVSALSICHSSFPPCNPSDGKDFLMDFMLTRDKYLPNHTITQTAPKIPLYEANGVYWNAYMATGSDGEVISTTPSYKNSPYFFGYTQYDEPSLIEKPALLSRYSLWKSRDSNHPIITNVSKDLWEFKDTADIMSWDTYPVRTNTDRQTAVARYEISTKTYAFSTGKVPEDFLQPIWSVIQANGKVAKETDINGVVKDILVPTYQEIKAMVYSSITFGVMGIGWWGYHQNAYGDVGFSVNPEQFANVKKITQGLKDLNIILVSPTIAHSWAGRLNNNAVVITPNPIQNTVQTFNYILKQGYLIVVNKFPTPQANVAIKVSGITASKVTTIGNETIGSQKAGRILSVVNNQFIDSFDGLAVHIYQIGGIVPPPCPDVSINMEIT